MSTDIIHYGIKKYLKPSWVEFLYGPHISTSIKSKVAEFCDLLKGNDNFFCLYFTQTIHESRFALVELELRTDRVFNTEKGTWRRWMCHNMILDAVVIDTKESQTKDRKTVGKL